MRIGVLTGGGDCPGLNAVIRAVVRKGVEEYGHEFVGFRDGWKGPLEGAHDAARRPGGPRDPAARRHDPRLVAHQPGQDRGRRRADRGQPRRARRRRAHRHRRRGHARRGDRACDEHGFKVVGVPKTIDNDLNATDYTFGFDTAVSIATEAIDRLHTTAESHHRALVVEVMGRHAGLDRPALGHRRRRQRHPHPRAAVRHRPGLRLGGAPLPDQLRADRLSSPRARCRRTAT